MGVVVAATHIQLEERYALKFMLPRAMENKDASARFLQEARAAAKLKSEHVAHVHDVGTLESGAPYIVMEYLEGEDLQHILRARGPVSILEIAGYVLQACDGIAEAHARGIVHRDLKPANLFVARGPDGNPLVKVLDFGISKASALSDSNVAMTNSAVILGSPLYMSPEQMKSSREVGPPTDQWSLGVILYEALCGRVPFDAGTLGELMSMVLTEPPHPLHMVRSDVSAELSGLVNRCLERDPARRFADVGELAKALAPWAPPALQPLAERVASVLRATHVSSQSGPSPRAISGFDATMEDRSGRLPGATKPNTNGGWGGTSARPAAGSTKSSSAPGTRVLVVAALALAAVAAAAGAGITWVRDRSARPPSAVAVVPAPREVLSELPPPRPDPVPAVESATAAVAAPSASARPKPADTPSPSALASSGLSGDTPKPPGDTPRPHAHSPSPRPSSSPGQDAFGDSRK
jgi:serine/threonine protein kinase